MKKAMVEESGDKETNKKRKCNHYRPEGKRKVVLTRKISERYNSYIGEFQTKPNVLFFRGHSH